MNNLLMTLALMIGSSSLQGVEACVTYNPSTNTYTVDQYGSVDKYRKDKPKKVKPEKKK